MQQKVNEERIQELKQKGQHYEEMWCATIAEGEEKSKEDPDVV